jgi:hypothetical protein
MISKEGLEGPTLVPVNISTDLIDRAMVASII